jgi:hypothetical protein
MVAVGWGWVTGLEVLWGPEKLSDTAVEPTKGCEPELAEVGGEKDERNETLEWHSHW